MEMKETITLTKKLLLFQAKVNAIKKDGKNPHFKNSYTTINEILSEVKPLLTELGLVLTQPIKDNKVVTVVKDSESGEQISSELEIPANLNAQQIGGCITYFRRYTLTCLLALESTDDDGTEAVKQPTKPTSAKTTLVRNSETYYKVVEALTNGTGTLAQVQSKYELTKELETEFKNINK